MKILLRFSVLLYCFYILLSVFSCSFPGMICSLHAGMSFLILILRLRRFRFTLLQFGADLVQVLALPGRLHSLLELLPLLAELDQVLEDVVGPVRMPR